MNWVSVQKKILDELAKGRAWYLGELRGRAAYTNGHVMWLIPSEDLLLTKERAKEGSSILASVEKWDKEAKEMFRFCFTGEDGRTVEYYHDGKGAAVAIDQSLKAGFEKCEVKGIEETLPLMCYDGGQLCGIVMPIRTKNNRVMEVLKNVGNQG